MAECTGHRSMSVVLPTVSTCLRSRRAMTAPPSTSVHLRVSTRAPATDAARRSPRSWSTGERSSLISDWPVRARQIDVMADSQIAYVDIERRADRDLLTSSLTAYDPQRARW